MTTEAAERAPDIIACKDAQIAHLCGELAAVRAVLAGYGHIATGPIDILVSDAIGVERDHAEAEKRLRKRADHDAATATGAVERVRHVLKKAGLESEGKPLHQLVREGLDFARGADGTGRAILIGALAFGAVALVVAGFAMGGVCLI